MLCIVLCGCGCVVLCIVWCGFGCGVGLVVLCCVLCGVDHYRMEREEGFVHGMVMVVAQSRVHVLW